MAFLADIENAVYFHAPELWRRELLEAGWSPWHDRDHYWQDPSGDIYFGVYRAWRTMREQA